MPAGFLPQREVMGSRSVVQAEKGSERKTCEDDEIRASMVGEGTTHMCEQKGAGVNKGLGLVLFTGGRAEDRLQNAPHKYGVEE